MRIKQVALVVLTLLISHFAARAQHQTYSRAKVLLDGDSHNIRQLASTGVAVDHGQHKKNTFFISDFSATEIAAMRSAGFTVQILIKDVTQYYQDPKRGKTGAKATAGVTCNPVAAVLPSHFHLGSYGGHFTYSELLAILDSMQMLYPGIISTRQAIDTYHTVEGRPIYYVKISNHPAVYDSARPQLLYTAVHHAREPGSMTSLIFYMWYLLEHYSTDAHVRSIIDNTELYFVPCLNPDGYEYNIATNPTGGGLWRKNRRDNGSGIYGVDINRNYGYFWGYDNVGSSPFATSDTYRGPAGFSEPETQAAKWICEHHRFLFTLNYHSFGNDIIYPWGYIGSLLTPDSSQFQACGEYLTEGIPYRYGTGDQTVGYLTNGDSDDWLYGEQTTKNKILAFTPEIGTMYNGFYPPVSEIIPDCRNNLVTSLHAADMLLPFATINSADQKIITRTAGYLHYDLQRLGYRDTTYSVSFTSLDSRLAFTSPLHSHSGLALLQHQNDSVAYTIASGTLNGQLLKYERRLSNGYYSVADTIEFYYSSNFTNITPGTNNLTDWVTGDWDTCTTVFHSAPASIGSSPTGCTNYADSTYATLFLSHAVDLTHTRHAYLYFWAKWGIEANYDYASVQAAPTGTGDWNPLCGRYTKQGSTFQSALSAIYDGQQFGWVQEEMDLGDYTGQIIDLQMVMYGDDAVNYSGFFVDDMNIISIRDTNTSSPVVLAATKAVNIFPNPASDRVHVQVTGYPNLHDLTVTVYDNVGRPVIAPAVVGAAFELNTSTLAPGMYFIKAESAEVPLPVTRFLISR